jgi:hypothetical protein
MRSTLSICAVITAINFDEFVFLPEPGKDYFNRNYYCEMLQYYFFEPYGNRLNRAWKKDARITNCNSGGHRLSGATLKFPPFNHLLRHYIVLSAEHAKKKYLHRTFDINEIEKGWHGNRLNFTYENLELPDESQFLFRLGKYDSRPLFKENPSKRHFWEWKNRE